MPIPDGRSSTVRPQGGMRIIIIGGLGGATFMTASDWNSARRNWTVTLMFALTAAAAISVVPWYGISHGFHAAAWMWFALLLTANELAITCGYHRLFAHATY